MNFTGERVVPGEVDADLFNEHWTRYLFASRYAEGKRVLDVACGSGYGSALLAESAAQVIGTDIAQEAMDYARRHYSSPNLIFTQADCFSLPFGAAQFALIVAFEIIEHIGDGVGFLKELRRVLAPDGLLLISTPNRLYYTEDRGEVNPFHEREYSYPEFAETLRIVFPHCSVLLENHIAGLLVADSSQAGNLTENPLACRQSEYTHNPAGAQQREQEAYYMIALCSAQPLPPAQPLLYLPSSGNVLRERETHIRQLEQHLAEARQERDTAREQFHQLEKQLDERTRWARTLDQELEESHRWAKALDQKLGEQDAYVLQLQADYDLKVQWARNLQQDVEQARLLLQKLQQEFDERTAWALRLDQELQERTAWALRLDQELQERTAWALRLDQELQERLADLRLLFGSRWYRIGKNLRLSPVPASDQQRNLS
ncbi:MAG: methyltransferase domain-containing protein [Acidobacteria bacterium]|nr:methyltransferase domain-containing protein [Acidobacteriota bacterium]